MIDSAVLDRPEARSDDASGPATARCTHIYGDDTRCPVPAQATLTPSNGEERELCIPHLATSPFRGGNIPVDYHGLTAEIAKGVNRLDAEIADATGLPCHALPAGVFDVAGSRADATPDASGETRNRVRRAESVLAHGLCLACPIRLACLARAVLTAPADDHLIRGGTAPPDRVPIRRTYGLTRADTEEKWRRAVVAAVDRAREQLAEAS